MKNRIIALLSALALLFGAGLFAAPAAQAGTLCNTVSICGVAINSPHSNGNLSVTNSIPAKSVWSLSPGVKSSKYMKDADQFRVPSGCTGYLQSNGQKYNGGTWYKINDLQVVTIRIYC